MTCCFLLCKGEDMNLFKILLIFTSGVLVGIFFLALIQEGNKKKYEIKEKRDKASLE